jgi:hypothetical protein
MQAPDVIQRAAGGKVDIEPLVKKLIQRWKQAKRQTDQQTKPLLQLSDSVVAKALEAAQEHI